ncbi:MAG TPA: hypothetical protein VNA30_06960 [Mycobacteriales bacterium]|nr:hypothetical protein [Mycobacteriales bacterium]
MSDRMRTYLLWRALALCLFLMSALMPRGLPAAAVCVVAGLMAVLSCVGTNAGGPGEQAGARAQGRVYDRVRPPQGDWPPFDESKVVDGAVSRD